MEHSDKRVAVLALRLLAFYVSRSPAAFAKVPRSIKDFVVRCSTGEDAPLRVGCYEFLQLVMGGQDAFDWFSKQEYRDITLLGLTDSNRYTVRATCHLLISLIERDSTIYDHFSDFLQSNISLHASEEDKLAIVDVVWESSTRRSSSLETLFDGGLVQAVVLSLDPLSSRLIQIRAVEILKDIAAWKPSIIEPLLWVQVHKLADQEFGTLAVVETLFLTFKTLANYFFCSPKNLERESNEKSSVLTDVGRFFPDMVDYCLHSRDTCVLPFYSKIDRMDLLFLLMEFAAWYSPIIPSPHFYPIFDNAKYHKSKVFLQTIGFLSTREADGPITLRTIKSLDSFTAPKSSICHLLRLIPNSTPSTHLLPVLRRRLLDEDWEVRDLVLERIGSLAPSDEYLELAISRLMDEQPFVRASALLAVKEMCLNGCPLQPDHVAGVLKSLHDSEAIVRRAGLEVVASFLKTPVCEMKEFGVDNVMELGVDVDYEVRIRFVEVLKAIVEGKYYFSCRISTLVYCSTNGVLDKLVRMKVPLLFGLRSALSTHILIHGVCIRSKTLPLMSRCV